MTDEHVHVQVVDQRPLTGDTADNPRIINQLPFNDMG
jgi:hypothetical protein